MDKFPKKIQISNFMGIRPVGTELFDADGQTNTDRSLFTILRTRPTKGYRSYTLFP
jgi:hypothetical protein